MVESYLAREQRPADRLRFLRDDLSRGRGPTGVVQCGRQVPAGDLCVRRTMAAYGKCTGKPVKAGQDSVPPPDPGLVGKGVQHKPEREQAAQDQSEQLSNPSLTHVTLQHPND